MSVLSTLVLAWAAVHTYMAVFYGFLHLRRRTDREYLAFAVMEIGFAVFSFGEALLTDATSIAEGAHAIRIGYVGLTVAAGALVDLCLLLIGRGQSRLVTFAYGWAALGLAANLAGLFCDPSLPARAAAESFYQQPDLHPVGVLWGVVACLTVGWAILQVARWVRLETDLRMLVVVVFLVVLVALHDVVVHAMGVHQVYLLGHAAVLASFTVSYLLLRRFVQAGDELTRRTIELRRSYEDLRMIQEELVRKEQLAAVGELSAVIAHEVRNPLAIMKNAVSGLRRDTLGESDRTTLLSILDEESDRLNRLVHDLLAYARPVTPGKEATQVEELLQDVIDAAGREVRDSDVDIELELGGPESIHCDRDLLARALTNVVENAIQAMPAGGTLVVTTRESAAEHGPALVLEFRDSGEGMDTLVRKKARDPFFTTRPAGTGLGLAIVERVVRAHGGELTIHSRYGSGTNVTVAIPLERPSHVPDEV